MIPCSLDCIHQTEGYCILSGGATVTSTTAACPHFEGRRLTRSGSNDPLDRFVHRARVDQLNGVGDLGTH